jgi:hypothetical protein
VEKRPLPIRCTMKYLILPVSFLALAGGALSGHAQDAPAPNINSMPKWSEFPLPPEKVPTPAELLAKVTETQNQRRLLRTEVRALVWDESDPTVFAETARDKINPSLAGPVEATYSVAEIEALAAELRRKAAPPPVVN